MQHISNLSSYQWINLRMKLIKLVYCFEIIEIILVKNGLTNSKLYMNILQFNIKYFLILKSQLCCLIQSVYLNEIMELQNYNILISQVFFNLNNSHNHHFLIYRQQLRKLITYKNFFLQVFEDLNKFLKYINMLNTNNKKYDNKTIKITTNLLEKLNIIIDLTNEIV